MLRPLLARLRLRLAKTAPTPRAASSMVLDPSRLSVLHGPLQPHTRPGDTTHPTGFRRDGYCWGLADDVGEHYVAGVVTREFLQFSKARGNDLSTPRPGFAGLAPGCRWCLCVARWAEALAASARLGDGVVPRVDLAATALDTLRSVRIEDLQRFAVRDGEGEGDGGDAAPER
ncbi:hypothetical protein Q8F55_003701 [Vanrija albida]|uniref:DUF2237 domain-containing protein n=1 Tax=Vanrija albida TaxID=181172 RepID=A0ABR3Q4N8_9TREE